MARCHRPRQGRGEVLILRRRAPNGGQILPGRQLRFGSPARWGRHPGRDIRRRPPPRARGEPPGRGRRGSDVHQRPRRPGRARRGPTRRAEAPSGPGVCRDSRRVLPRRADHDRRRRRGGPSRHAELAENARAAAAGGRRPARGAGGGRAHLRAPREDILQKDARRRGRRRRRGRGRVEERAKRREGHREARVQRPRRLGRPRVPWFGLAPGPRGGGRGHRGGV